MRAEKNKFGRVGKSAYLCIRFHKEITKRYTSILVDRNVGTFYSEKQERCDGLRVLAWTVSHFCFSRYFRQPLSKEVVYMVPRFVIYGLLRHRQEWRKKKNGLGMFNKCRRNTDSRLYSTCHRLSNNQFLYDKQATA